MIELPPEQWRIFLYPLGFLSSLFFFGRLFAQWMSSETHKKSVVTPLFWYLSIMGNILLMSHSLVQVQWHVCAVQACHAVISWRNLNLMRPQVHPYSYKTVIALMAGAVAIITVAFIIQGFVCFNGEMDWVRNPTAPWQDIAAPEASLSWHIAGFLGIVLFGSRFWVQWWYAEKYKISKLSASFWWLSLSGAMLSIVYFLRIGDLVNLLGPGIGIIPYVRNLILISKSDKILVKQS